MGRLLNFAIISTSLMISSCSMVNHSENNPTSRQFILEPGQQFNTYHKMLFESEKATFCAEADQYCIKESFIQDVKNDKVPESVADHKYTKKLHKDFSKEIGRGKNIELKLAHDVTQLLPPPANTTVIKSIKQSNPVTFLILWIAFLLAAILFGYLAIVSAVATALLTAVLFYVLATLASILALIFFIVWIVQLLSG